MGAISNAAKLSEDVLMIGPVGGLDRRPGRTGRGDEPSPGARLTRQDGTIFVAGFMLYVGMALELRRLDLYIGDAVSRTAQAFAVLFARDPHLAAIGFAWNPLPILVQVPVVAVLRVLHLDVVVAGNLLSASCGAATLVVLNVTMRRAGLPGRLRWLLIALFGLNPMILLYSANGMSEALFILLIVVTVTSFVWWTETRTPAPFMTMTIASILATQTRYEAVMLTASIAVCLVISCMPLATSGSVPVMAQRIESYLIVYGVGPAYAFGSWVFFNWTIEGDPLYFVHSVYGNAAQTAQIRAGAATYLHGAVHSIPGALLFGLERSLWLFPFAAAIMLAAALAARAHRDVALMCTLLIAVALPVFEAAMIDQGESFGWLRFFIYSIPFSYLLLIGVYKTAPGLFRGRRGWASWTVILLSLLASNMASWTAMATPAVGREEHYITCKVFHPRCPSSVSGKAYALQGVREVSAYVERLPSPGTVLLDAYQGFAIPLVSAHPTRYVVTSDRDFAYSVLHPAATVRYVLVPAPTGLGRSDRINRQYPSLWPHGASWAKLVREFRDTQDDWKLYEVVVAPRRHAAEHIVRCATCR